MSNYPYTRSHSPSSAALIAAVAARSEALARSVLHRVVGYWRYRRTAVALAALSDRTLKDIGIERSQIETISRHCGRRRL